MEINVKEKLKQEKLIQKALAREKLVDNVSRRIIRRIEAFEKKALENINRKMGFMEGKVSALYAAEMNRALTESRLMIEIDSVNKIKRILEKRAMDNAI